MQHIFRIILLGLALACTATVSAAQQTPEERGKAHFNDPKLGGGTSGRSCNTCHPGGKGLFGVADKMGWATPAGRSRTLEDAINICITKALNGKPLGVKSREMQDLIAYLRTLKPKP
ncbi:MAG: hypothetical protein M0042_01235 [Nitrospiraceae bacterium]|nr:hypothetical protein [Nitrospiraceae bacterium]